MSERPASSVRRDVERVSLAEGVVRRRRSDRLATEEPLEIRVASVESLRGGRVPPGAARPVAVTMRTPGSDFELASGFLFSERIVRDRADIVEVRYCTDSEQRYNVVNVVLARAAASAMDSLPDRAFPVTSACGVCGSATIAHALGEDPVPVESGLTLDPAVLVAMPEVLRGAQPVFERTGGLHAAALFTADGRLLRLREDVGRHNAMDKLVGASLLAGELPLRDGVVLVSGRLSFELVQKAARAGVPVVAAVSAPSSLAVLTAEAAGMTLVGFVRGRQFNVYTGGRRIVSDASTLR